MQESRFKIKQDAKKKVTEKDKLMAANSVESRKLRMLSQMMIKMKMHCFELESVKQVTDTVQSHPSLFIRANIDSDDDDDDVDAHTLNEIEEGSSSSSSGSENAHKTNI